MLFRSVHVGAKDLGTGKEQKVRIESSSGLSSAEIEKMMREAKEHESEDKSRKELIEVRNQADSLIYSTEKTIKENSDKISESDKKSVEDAIAELRKRIESEDINSIKAGTESLQGTVHKMSESLYKGQENEPKREDFKPTENADYEVVDE